MLWLLVLILFAEIFLAFVLLTPCFTVKAWRTIFSHEIVKVVRENRAILYGVGGVLLMSALASNHGVSCGLALIALVLWFGNYYLINADDSDCQECRWNVRGNTKMTPDENEPTVSPSPTGLATVSSDDLQKNAVSQNPDFSQADPEQVTPVPVDEEKTPIDFDQALTDAIYQATGLDPNVRVTQLQVPEN